MLSDDVDDVIVRIGILPTKYILSVLCRQGSGFRVQGSSRLSIFDIP